MNVSALLALLLISLPSSHGWGESKLIVIGGGDRPARALQAMADWSQQERGRILIVAWASRIPEEVAQGLVDDLSVHFRGRFDFSLMPPTSPRAQRDFSRQLDLATGVFFSGGHQSRILDVFSEPGGDELKMALKRRYRAGTVMGGTSAGTAIMSEVAITGYYDGDQPVVAAGLGLLPHGLMIDQHFSQKNRTERLLLASAAAKAEMAIGVDEDTALILTGGQRAEVFGAHGVHFFKENQLLRVLNDGDTWMLVLGRCEAALLTSPGE